MPRGEQHANATITEADVRAIRALKQTGASNRQLAAKFWLSPATISYIVNRKRWAHVE
jgi:IS30 family transposase